MDDSAPTEWNDARLLAAIIGRGAASLLLRRYGGLRQLLHADPDELAGCRGVGDAR